MATRTSTLVTDDDLRDVSRTSGFARSGVISSTPPPMSMIAKIERDVPEEDVPPTVRSACFVIPRKSPPVPSMTLAVVMAAAIWVGLALLAAALLWPMTLAAHLGFLFLGTYLVCVGAVRLATTRFEST